MNLRKQIERIGDQGLLVRHLQQARVIDLLSGEDFLFAVM